jgi:transcriptional regulator with XRE-family HTH domain
MAKKTQTPTVDTTPKFITKAEFGRRVHQYILKKGWTQSELARRSGLPRDSISTYVRGAVFPSELSLDKLAKALGVKAEELLPNKLENTISRSQHPSFEMKASETEPGLVWLRVDRLVKFASAVQIANILDNDDAARPSAH